MNPSQQARLTIGRSLVFAGLFLQTSILVKSMSPAELSHEVSGKRVTVIDVNSDERFQQGHVPGALHLNGAENTEADLPADKATAVVFYRSNALCRKAPNAAKRARKMG